MPPKALTRWRPLTIGDVAFLLNIRADYVKTWIKRGTAYGVAFCPPRWVSTSDQRLWSYADLERWATEFEFEIRPLTDLEAEAETRRAALGWAVAR
jgi:hypothetical protein